MTDPNILVATVGLQSVRFLEVQLRQLGMHDAADYERQLGDAIELWEERGFAPVLHCQVPFHAYPGLELGEPVP